MARGLLVSVGIMPEGVAVVSKDQWEIGNQMGVLKEDYLDTSYLYRKPRATTLSSNDVLLVQYDVFNGGDAGVKTISSYPIDDTLGLIKVSLEM